MSRWSRYFLKLTAASVVLTGNFFVCAVLTPPAFAAAPAAAIPDHCGQSEAAAPAPAPHADPGPFFTGSARHGADGCPMTGHNETQPAIERPETFLAASVSGSIGFAVVNFEYQRADFTPAFSANTFDRAGPAASAPTLVGTTVKKE